MSITKERLETRLTELKLQAEHLKQQFMATTGAIADIEFWLQEDSKSAETAENKD